VNNRVNNRDRYTCSNINFIYLGMNGMKYNLCEKKRDLHMND
jgi:hypothetical protein